MLEKIFIKNFRSIEEAEISLAPITVLYGPTSSGKSSLFYALLTLRNFIQNPNRQADGLFHLGFMDLGGLEACVFNHDKDREIGIGIEHKCGSQYCSYGIRFDKTTARIEQEVPFLKMNTIVNIPYGLNQSTPFTYTENGEEYTINWNGITSTCSPKKPTAETQARALELAFELNAPAEVFKTIDMVPHRRGFFKPTYTPGQVSPTPTSEDEVASIIINDQNLPGRISTYAEDIFDREFRIWVVPGTSTVYFHLLDKKARMTIQLVNEGFGVNQVIYMLAKLLRVEIKTILIEEPEIHLHPTALRKFVRTLSTLIQEEEKQVICTTHSEQFMISLLTLVEEGCIKADDVKCYLTAKDKKKTAFKMQDVHKGGQIEGGLSSFIEAETEDLKKFLGLNKKNV